MKRLRIRNRHHRAQPDPEPTCEFCQVGRHSKCEGTDLYGEPCECAECERSAREAAEDLQLKASVRL